MRDICRLSCARVSAASLVERGLTFVTVSLRLLAGRRASKVGSCLHAVSRQNCIAFAAGLFSAWLCLYGANFAISVGLKAHKIII